MIAITDKQAEDLAKEIFKAGGDYDLTAADVKVVFNGLCDALNAGTILDSGDGFFYFLRRKNGNLVCHDMSQLRGSLYSQVSQFVWQKETRLREIVKELTHLELKTIHDDGYDPADVADQVHQALMSLGACRHERRRSKVS